MENFLEERIYLLQIEMNRQVLICGCLTHENVLIVSRELDKYISVYQKLKRKKRF
ncbi:aspartyl-phosphate phosphatase Spo0E family protein [Paenibacillus sp. OV219]|uniref:aspartyl-phosphate phosphatase Spo0E family protein n=1 Tax=Paenibacillus sp. OV219 TaxID=1884377 RepID=UPI0008AB0F28|nr:Spo0E like sporulation regulatory protein [Paenibacillus sp. OV219]